MKRTKEYRRHCAKVKKNKIIHLLKDVWHQRELISKKQVGRMATTPHPCSCDMCCNGRNCKCGNKNQKITLEQRRSNDDMKEQLQQI